MWLRDTSPRYTHHCPDVQGRSLPLPTTSLLSLSLFLLLLLPYDELRHHDLPSHDVLHVETSLVEKKKRFEAAEGRLDVSFVGLHEVLRAW